MNGGPRSQKSAEYHEYHDDEEAESKKGVLRPPKGEEHDLDGSSKVSLVESLRRKNWWASLTGEGCYCI